MIWGRIVKGIGGFYTVQTAEGAYVCKARGLFRKDHMKPYVGDWVGLEVVDDANKEGYIQEIKERRNCLFRPSIANIDQVVLVFATSNPAPSFDLLDRFLVQCEIAGVDIAICINKSDLDQEFIVKFMEVYGQTGYPILFSSTLLIEENGQLGEILKGKVSVLAGPSGVGKTSLINTLKEGFAFPVGEVSEKIGRGKHTTRHVELLEIFPETFVADSPGFSSLDMHNVALEVLPQCFPEFRGIQGHCRYSSCRHMDEPGCSVKEQVGNSVSLQRYQRYTIFMNEILDRKR